MHQHAAAILSQSNSRQLTVRFNGPLRARLYSHYLIIQYNTIVFDIALLLKFRSAHDHNGVEHLYT